MSEVKLSDSFLATSAEAENAALLMGGGGEPSHPVRGSEDSESTGDPIANLIKRVRLPYELNLDHN